MGEIHLGISGAVVPFEAMPVAEMTHALNLRSAGRDQVTFFTFIGVPDSSVQQSPQPGEGAFLTPRFSFAL
jgi:hypothetical protein